MFTFLRKLSNLKLPPFKKFWRFSQITPFSNGYVHRATFGTQNMCIIFPSFAEPWTKCFRHCMKTRHFLLYLLRIFCGHMLEKVHLWTCLKPFSSIFDTFWDITNWKFLNFHLNWPMTLKNRSRSMKLGQCNTLMWGYLVVQYQCETPKKVLK